MTSSSDSSILADVRSEYSSSPFARQATSLSRQGREIATAAIEIIDNILFHSDAVEMLQRRASSKPPSSPLQDENNEMNPATEGKVKEEAKESRSNSQRSIKKLSTAIMHQLALKPVSRATIARMNFGWNRRRASTAVSVLIAIGVVREMGGSDGFRHLLLLNKNAIILSGSVKQLISNYNAMKQWEQLLQKQLNDMLVLFSSLRKAKDAAEPPPTKKPRTASPDPQTATDEENKNKTTTPQNP